MIIKERGSRWWWLVGCAQLHTSVCSALGLAADPRCPSSVACVCEWCSVVQLWRCHCVVWWRSVGPSSQVGEERHPTPQPWAVPCLRKSGPRRPAANRSRSTWRRMASRLPKILSYCYWVSIRRVKSAIGNAQLAEQISWSIRGRPTLLWCPEPRCGSLGLDAHLTGAGTTGVAQSCASHPDGRGHPS